MSKFSWLVIWLALILPSALASQESQYGIFLFDERYPDVLLLDGPITLGDVEDFRKALREHKPSLLALNSPGGSVSVSLEISAIVNDRSIETYVPTNAECASACSFIFFAGSPRSVLGTLGVHQFTSQSERTENVSVTQVVTQEVAARIIDYLHSFGTPGKVFVRMYETPPNEMHWFSPKEIIEEGIQIDTVSYLPEFDLGRALRPTEETITEATPTRRSRPSFDCSKASTPSEYAVCANVQLGKMDAQLSLMYKFLKETLSKTSFSFVRNSQRAWLKERESCGSNVPCLNTVYRRRLVELR